jgi:hypothetical protein
MNKWGKVLDVISHTAAVVGTIWISYTQQNTFPPLFLAGVTLAVYFGTIYGVNKWRQARAAE